jgi:hypothetical protein
VAAWTGSLPEWGAHSARLRHATLKLFEKSFKDLAVYKEYSKILYNLIGRQSNENLNPEQ